MYIQETSDQKAGRSRWCGVGMLISAAKTPATVRSAPDVHVIRKDHGGKAVETDDTLVAINGISTLSLSIPEVKALIRGPATSTCILTLGSKRFASNERTIRDLLSFGWTSDSRVGCSTVLLHRYVPIENTHTRTHTHSHRALAAPSLASLSIFSPPSSTSTSPPPTSGGGLVEGGEGGQGEGIAGGEGEGGGAASGGKPVLPKLPLAKTAHAKTKSPPATALNPFAWMGGVDAKGRKIS